jgi:hypothetical protein
LHSSDPGEKEWEYNERVHQLFKDFKREYLEENIVQYSEIVLRTQETR